MCALFLQIPQDEKKRPVRRRRPAKVETTEGVLDRLLAVPSPACRVAVLVSEVNFVGACRKAIAHKRYRSAGYDAVVPSGRQRTPEIGDAVGEGSSSSMGAEGRHLGTARRS